MRLLLCLAAGLMLARPAFAQPVPRLVPCASISPDAVISVPAPFDADMKLVCYDASGQGLVPADGSHWLDGNTNAYVGLSSMDDRAAPDGQPRFSPGWYVSLTPRQLSPSADAKLRRVLRQAVKPLFIVGAKISELDAATAAGQVKQEFIVSPADPVATHGIRLLIECHQLCQGSDKPWVLGILPANTNNP
jgi:hypothetical protein